MERKPLNNCMTKTRKQQEQQQRVSEKWKGSTFATYDLSGSGWRHVFEFSSLFLDFDVWTEIAWIRCGEMGMFFEGIYGQRVPIYLPSNKVPTPGGKTMMWYRWFSKGTNQQLLCTFHFSINFFITFYVFFLKNSCAKPKGTTLATTRPCDELWLVEWW